MASAPTIDRDEGEYDCDESRHGGKHDVRSVNGHCASVLPVQRSLGSAHDAAAGRGGLAKCRCATCHWVCSNEVRKMTGRQ